MYDFMKYTYLDFFEFLSKSINRICRNGEYALAGEIVNHLYDELEIAVAQYDESLES